jgi:hypothetical protein
MAESAWRHCNLDAWHTEIEEWVSAGFFFDLFGATYSQVQPMDS